MAASGCPHIAKLLGDVSTTGDTDFIQKYKTVVSWNVRYAQSVRNPAKRRKVSPISTRNQVASLKYLARCLRRRVAYAILLFPVHSHACIAILLVAGWRGMQYVICVMPDTIFVSCVFTVKGEFLLKKPLRLRRCRYKDRVYILCPVPRFHLPPKS